MNNLLDKITVIGNTLYADGVAYVCATGKGGFKTDKREGDGASPIGTWPLRECFYRPDQLEKPTTHLPIKPIQPDDGWCDAPESQYYNLLVKLPFNQSHEKMWRDDHVYNVVIPLGYNDAPVVAGKGSAIFLHLARPNFEPTEGCIALALPDMLSLLPRFSTATQIEVRPK
ncbi:MAG: L,D-transpeptidase family protein [Rickettsiales bacterium]|nr:L,D-transpeptidase family protein [Rickettsiales bacterium]